jgi:predicted aspartyl protease
MKCRNIFEVTAKPGELTPQNPARLSMVLLWVGFLLSSQLCTGGAASQNPKPRTLETYLQQLGYGEIRLKRTEQNHLAVEGELNGKKAVFMIDTGNSVTRLDKKTGSRFKTLAERGIRLMDPNLGGFSGSNFVLVDEMKLGTARFPNQPAHVTALAHVSTSAYEISTSAYEDCLVGCDFLLRHHCLLDCAGLKLYVRADKPSTDIRAALESSLRQSGYHETILIPTRGLVELCPAKVNGVALRLLVDSGSVFTFLDDHRGRQSPLAKLRVWSTDRLNQGIGSRGGTPIYAADPESFQVDGVEVSLRKTRLGVTDLTSFNIGMDGAQMDNVDGVLGADVLAISGGLVDIENRRLWFVIPKKRVSSKAQ